MADDHEAEPRTAPSGSSLHLSLLHQPLDRLPPRLLACSSSFVVFGAEEEGWEDAGIMQRLLEPLCSVQHPRVPVPLSPPSPPSLPLLHSLPADCPRLSPSSLCCSCSLLSLPHTALPAAVERLNCGNQYFWSPLLQPSGSGLGFLIEHTPSRGAPRPGEIDTATESRCHAQAACNSFSFLHQFHAAQRWKLADGGTAALAGAGMLRTAAESLLAWRAAGGSRTAPSSCQELRTQ